MRTQGITYDKCKAFAIEVIALCNNLREKGEYVMSKQILRSGTSIGANYCEALGSESPQDFVHKLSISLKEANETYFWLDILHSSGHIDADRFNGLKEQLEEIYKMMNSASITVKKRNNILTQ
ncbi:MAG: four helix bundle protein [Bacteroidales bacterium]|jgi:four helix bundle protein|nr:four helix bundle protein [Bacteroidales bacterium]